MTVLISAGTGAVAVIVVFVAVIGALLPGGGADADAVPACAAPEDIPRRFYDLYVKAGTDYGIPWNVLSAIGKAESDHGRGTSPGIRSGANSAGASGPMQFMPSTWAAFGQDGNRDGVRDVYAPEDAIPAAAAYLKHNGAPARIRNALFRYNHSTSYVRHVMKIAGEYAGASGGCRRVEVTASGKAAVAVRAALRWIGTPYSWGGGGFNGPTRGIAHGAGTVGFDCSGLTRYAWHKAGVTIPRIAADQWRRLPHVPRGQRRSGDLVFFGSAKNPGHVGILLDPDRMIEAPRTGLRVRISPLATRRDIVGYARPR